MLFISVSIIFPTVKPSGCMLGSELHSKISPVEDTNPKVMGSGFPSQEKRSGLTCYKTFSSYTDMHKFIINLQFRDVILNTCFGALLLCTRLVWCGRHSLGQGYRFLLQQLSIILNAYCHDIYSCCTMHYFSSGNYVEIIRVYVGCLAYS